MASFSEITINSRSPFTEEVKIACNPHVNLFIGTNGTGKSTLIRHIKNRSHSYPCVMIPPNRLALPRSPDDDGHSDLIRGINDVKDIAEALVDNQTTFDSRRVYYVKTMMRNRLLTENGSAELADSYFKALSLSYSCAQQICGELLSPVPPEDYTWQKTFLVNETVTMPSGAATTRQREAGTATNVYSRMGLSVTHDVPFNRRGTYNKVFTGDLSDGTQGTLSWIEYLALRIANFYGFRAGWEALPAVLLIDEIENHLHPTWQRRVIQTLLGCFSGLQIFATTHSPFVVAGLEPGQVHRLFRDDQQIVRAEMPNEAAIVGWTIDEILRGLMGVEDPTDEKTAQSARELRRLRNETPRDNEMEENERLRLIEELSQSVDKTVLAGGIDAADQELFEQQFKAALEQYRASTPSNREEE